MIFFEDSAALLGLVFAFSGILAGRVFNNPYADGVASVLIGLLLGVISIFLVYETRGLLIGEAVEPETLRLIRKLIEADEDVEHVGHLLTMHFGPHEVLLNLEVRFRDKLSAVGVRTAVGRLRKNVRKHYPDITRIYFASESVTHDHPDGD